MLPGTAILVMLPQVQISSHGDGGKRNYPSLNFSAGGTNNFADTTGHGLKVSGSASLQVKSNTTCTYALTSQNGVLWNSAASAPRTYTATAYDASASSGSPLPSALIHPENRWETASQPREISASLTLTSRCQPRGRRPYLPVNTWIRCPYRLVRRTDDHSGLTGWPPDAAATDNIPFRLNQESVEQKMLQGKSETLRLVRQHSLGTLNAKTISE